MCPLCGLLSLPPDPATGLEKAPGDLTSPLTPRYCLYLEESFAESPEPSRPRESTAKLFQQVAFLPKITTAPDGTGVHLGAIGPGRLMPDQPRDEGLPARMQILPLLGAHFHPAPPSVLTLDLDGEEGNLTMLPSLSTLRPTSPTPPLGTRPWSRRRCEVTHFSFPWSSQ